MEHRKPLVLAVCLLLALLAACQPAGGEPLSLIHI